MRRVYVALRQEEIEALRRLALIERRHPADQAAELLVEALRQREGQKSTQDRRPVEAGA